MSPGTQYGKATLNAMRALDPWCVTLLAFVDLRTSGPNGRPIHGEAYMARELRWRRQAVHEHLVHLDDAGVVSVYRDGNKAVVVDLIRDDVPLLPERPIPPRPSSKYAAKDVVRETHNVSEVVVRETHNVSTVVDDDAPVVREAYSSAVRETHNVVVRETHNVLGMAVEEGLASDDRTARVAVAVDDRPAWDRFRCVDCGGLLAGAVRKGAPADVDYCRCGF
jgi:hypothetical protein